MGRDTEQLGKDLPWAWPLAPCPTPMPGTRPLYSPHFPSIIIIQTGRDSSIQEFMASQSLGNSQRKGIKTPCGLSFLQAGGGGAEVVEAVGFFGQCCSMDSVMDTNPSLQTFSTGRDVGQEKASEGVNVVLGGEGFARDLCKGQRKSSSEDFAFLFSFECI